MSLQERAYETLPVSVQVMTEVGRSALLERGGAAGGGLRLGLETIEEGPPGHHVLSSASAASTNS